MQKSEKNECSCHYIITSCMNRLFSDDECDGLPLTWTSMTTDTVFPVSVGTILVMTCNDGFANQGASSVTCLANSTYSYSAEPQCIKGNSVNCQFSQEGVGAQVCGT